MKLSEIDLIFLIGSVFGLLAGAPLVIYFVWGYFFSGESIPAWKFILVMTIFLVGIARAWKHIKYCRQLLKR